MSDPLDNVAQIEKKIADNAARADASIGVPSNEIATQNKGVIRIKGQDLLKKNQNEPHWPGGRTHFQIDRDQIIFNPNFVRLARKTQLFIGQRDALYKNRLMHSLEVVQFSQSVARETKNPTRPSLNPDLVEAIAYGHDIGHTPFGHAGEETLNACLYEYHIQEILKDISKYARSFDSSPYSQPSPGDTEGERVQRLSQAIRMFVESALLRYPGTYITGVNPLTRKEAEALLGVALLDDLKKLDVIHVEDDACYFNPPITWQWGKEAGNRIKRHYWLDEKSREFFAHNVHALRIILADNSRPSSDITPYTAWGILTHTPRKYTSFTCLLPSGQVKLTDELETPEAFLVRKTDDICFANSDIEDARKSDLIKFGFLDPPEKVAMWHLAIDDRYDGASDFPENSQRLQFCERGFHFVKGASSSYAKVERIKAARDVIRKRVYPILASRQAAAKRIIRELFWFYTRQPLSNEISREIEDDARKEKDRFFEKRNMDAEVSTPRKATDFIAHMTDEEVLDTHRALFSPEHAKWARYFVKSGRVD